MNQNRILLCLTSLVFLLGLQTLNAQFNFVYNDSITVLKNSDTLSMPWAGGMSHPQFSTIDLDFNGKEEIIAFEPENGMISVFEKTVLNGNLSYRYLYNANKNFPSDLRYRIKLVDYNNDGLKDLFAYSPGGIKVYKNTGDATSGLSWELVKDPILTYVFGSTSNLYSASNEIPAFVDVDEDGDIDVLTFHSSISRVEWHKNLSVESYGHSDSLIFELEQGCWGDFMESSSGNTIELNSVLAPCGTSFSLYEGAPRHSGGSLLALDMNGSGLKDLIIGDVDFNNLTMLINGGTNPNNNALMTSFDDNFPSNDIPADLSNYLTAYYEDVDNDSINDLIVSTTAAGSSENTKGVWLYKNNGTNDNPDFKFIEEDFLQKEMIENGKGSIPILVDVNNDGLQDLLVANHFNYYQAQNNSSRIIYYQNIGSLLNPKFNLVNDNWKNFKNSGFSGRVSPSFADLDGDGDKDMIIGLSNGKFYFYENSGGSGAMNFNVVHTQLMDNNGAFITVPNFATPELFDLDNDGLTDLVIGQGSGPLIYYRNIGTATNYSFELTNPDLGQVDLTTSNYSQTVGVPRFIRENGETHLFAGTRSGNLTHYTRIDNRLTPGFAFELQSDNFVGVNTLGFSAPFIGQIRGDNSYDLFVGNELGGLWSFRPGDTTSLSTKAENPIHAIEMTIYPNPSNGNFSLELSNLQGQSYDYTIMDPMGRLINSQKNQVKSRIDIQLFNPKSGMYFVEVVLNKGERRMVSKLIVK